MKKEKSGWLVHLFKLTFFIILLAVLSSCSASHRHRSKTDRKKGLMLLENTSQSLNKKFKKSKYARKSARQHKRGRGLR